MEHQNEELAEKKVKSRKGWRKSKDAVISTSTNWSVISPEKWRKSKDAVTSTSTNWSVTSPEKSPNQSDTSATTAIKQDKDILETVEHNPNEINSSDAKKITKKRSRKKINENAITELSNDNNDVFAEPPAKKKRGRKKKESGS